MEGVGDRLGSSPGSMTSDDSDAISGVESRGFERGRTGRRGSVIDPVSEEEFVEEEGKDGEVLEGKKETWWRSACRRRSSMSSMLPGPRDGGLVLGKEGTRLDAGERDTITIVSVGGSGGYRGSEVEVGDVEEYIDFENM
jgi:hypothetical protein